jgi:hypothetical protein
MKTINTKHYWIQVNGDSVYFEHDTFGDECAASIRFDLRRLVDYSGVSVIPSEVVDALQKEGYNLA